MLLKQYKVQVIELSAIRRLTEAGKPTSWIIQANDLPSAWRRFCQQNFTNYVPNTAEYDISFHSTKSHEPGGFARDNQSFS